MPVDLEQTSLVASHLRPALCFLSWGYTFLLILMHLRKLATTAPDNADAAPKAASPWVGAVHLYMHPVTCTVCACD